MSARVDGAKAAGLKAQETREAGGLEELDCRQLCGLEREHAPSAERLSQ